MIRQIINKKMFRNWPVSISGLKFFLLLQCWIFLSEITELDTKQRKIFIVKLDCSDGYRIIS